MLTPVSLMALRTVTERVVGPGGLEPPTKRL